MSGETESAQKHVVMGRLGAPWGIKGWLKVQSFAEPPENLCEYRHFTLRKGGRLEEVELDTIKPHGKSFVAHIKGCDVREETSRYTGAELLVPTSELPELEEGYYWHELEGLQVVNTAGVVLGRVDHLLATGANDVLVVRGDADSVDREERLLPYVPEQVVLEVDLEQGRITVDWEADY